MALTLKPIADIASKWARRAGAAAPDYESGIRSPKRDWATAARDADSAWQAGVQDAVGRGAFARGVTKAGSDKWSRKALAVGPGRYPQGVTAGQTDYQNEFGPFRDAIERISLPSRGRRGDPANLERVRAIADALHQMKAGGK